MACLGADALGIEENACSAAKMSLRPRKSEAGFDWLLSDLCSRFGMSIGALGQVPTFAP